MKWKICNHYLLAYLFVAQTAHAAIPVTMSGPVPAIASSYDAGASNTFIYTITNNVPKKRFPITVKGISSPVTRTTVSNDCGNMIPTGPSTCKIGVLIAPTSDNAGNSINQNLSVDYRGRRPLIANIAFSVPGTPAPALLTAVGRDNTGSSLGLIAVSDDRGSNWTTKSVPGIPTSSIFKSASCVGAGPTAICTAAGENAFSGPALLAVSTDGGNTWAIPTITGAPADGRYFGTSCTGSGSNAICTAGGRDVTGSSPPLIVVSTDGGTTWESKSISGAPFAGNIFSISCTGSGSNAVCAGAGSDVTGTTPPLLVVSTDGGSTWTRKAITGDTTNGSFNAASCTGSGSSAICTAAGTDNIGISPYVAVSTDGGNTWARKSISGIGINAIFNATSCTGSGTSAICIAAGYNSSTSESVIAVSTDGGNTWAEKPVTGSPIEGRYLATSCTGSGANAICTAAGEDSDANLPLLAVSTDGGNTWATKTVTGMPASGAFRATSCTGSGSSAICIAAGEDDTGSTAPLLAISTNGGNTWATTTVAGLPAAGAFLGSAASSNSLALKHQIDHR